MEPPLSCTPKLCLVTTTEIYNAKEHRKSQILSAMNPIMPVKCWIQYLPCYPKHQVYVPFLSFGESFTQMSCSEINKQKQRKSSLSCQSSKQDYPFIRLPIPNANHPRNTQNLLNFTITFLCKYDSHRNDLSNLKCIVIQMIRVTCFACCQMYKCAAIQCSQPQKKNFDDMNPEACSE